MRSEPDLALLRSYAAELRARRTALGISQEELAGRAGVNRTFVAKVETAQSQPSLTILFKICEGLGADLPEMMQAVVKRYRKEMTVKRRGRESNDALEF